MNGFNERTAAGCPPWEQMVNYFRTRLSAVQTAEIDEHFATCEQCIEIAREAHEHALALETWTARSHGEAWRRELITAAFEEAAQAAGPSWNERIQAWRKNLRAATAGAVEVLVELTGARVVTTGLDHLVRRGGWRFEGAAVTRGETEAASTEASTSSGITVAVRAGKIEVSTPAWPHDRAAPLLLIAAVDGNYPPLLVPLVRDKSGRLAAAFPPRQGQFLILFVGDTPI